MVNKRIVSLINTDSLSKEVYENFKVRKATRILIFNTQNKIALLYETVKNYYSLPGGQIENNETPLDSAKRECLEETGFEINNIKFIGVIREVLSVNEKLNDSYIFIATKTKEQFKLSPQEDSEKNSILVWATPEEAITLIKNSNTGNNPIALSSRERDIEIINKIQGYI
jgi:8-oxo-dGTP pyrophosphatase MutT (NUDIX family)